MKSNCVLLMMVVVVLLSMIGDSMGANSAVGAACWPAALKLTDDLDDDDDNDDCDGGVVDVAVVVIADDGCSSAAADDDDGDGCSVGEVGDVGLDLLLDGDAGGAADATPSAATAALPTTMVYDASAAERATMMSFFVVSCVGMIVCCVKTEWGGEVKQLR